MSIAPAALSGLNTCRSPGKLNEFSLDRVALSTLSEVPKSVLPQSLKGFIIEPVREILQAESCQLAYTVEVRNRRIDIGEKQLMNDKDRLFVGAIAG